MHNGLLFQAAASLCLCVLVRLKLIGSVLPMTQQVNVLHGLTLSQIIRDVPGLNPRFCRSCLHVSGGATKALSGV